MVLDSKSEAGRDAMLRLCATADVFLQNFRPGAAERLGLGEAALRAENVNRPGGTLKDWSSVYLVRTLHEFTDLDQLRRTVVRPGPPLRVISWRSMAYPRSRIRVS